MKALYLWDLADTTFTQTWDKQKSGVPNYDAYIESLGYKVKGISPKIYEWAYEAPFKTGLMIATPLPGFQETLSWTKNNAAFTTGNHEQIGWRAERILKQGLFDVRPFFEKIYSTFDFGNFNEKTTAMFHDIIEKERQNGFDQFVYTDNKKENCEMFLNSAPRNILRCYHINEKIESTKRLEENYFETPNLLGLLKSEQDIKNYAKA